MTTKEALDIIRRSYILDGVFDHDPGCRAPDYSECTCSKKDRDEKAAAELVADQSVRERVAVMIGWKVGKSISGFPIYFPPPPRGDGERIERELPPFDTSLDACIEVFLWLKARNLQSKFIQRISPTKNRMSYWKVLNLRPMAICKAALAVGEKR